MRCWPRRLRTSIAGRGVSSASESRPAGGCLLVARQTGGCATGPRPGADQRTGQRRYPTQLDPLKCTVYAWHALALWPLSKNYLTTGIPRIPLISARLASSTVRLAACEPYRPARQTGMVQSHLQRGYLAAATIRLFSVW